MYTVVSMSNAVDRYVLLIEATLRAALERQDRGDSLALAIGFADGGRIVIEIKRAAEAPEGGLEIRISDNGRGMSLQELAIAQGGLKPGGEGAPERRTGLGIPLARQLIAAHDGTLDIVSRKGAGTTATIRLP